MKPLQDQIWDFNYFKGTPVIIEQIEGGNDFEVICEINPKREDKDQIQIALKAYPKVLSALIRAYKYLPKDLHPKTHLKMFEALKSAGINPKT